ncbi:hypothetical protein HDU89_002888 [Geranomyces variabilis]|nr:hypothetical protein HDU89_002888 [Geranomyces variabilis]
MSWEVVELRSAQLSAYWSQLTKVMLIVEMVAAAYQAITAVLETFEKAQEELCGMAERSRPTVRKKLAAIRPGAHAASFDWSRNDAEVFGALVYDFKGQATFYCGIHIEHFATSIAIHQRQYIADCLDQPGLPRRRALPGPPLRHGAFAIKPESRARSLPGYRVGHSDPGGYAVDWAVMVVKEWRRLLGGGGNSGGGGAERGSNCQTACDAEVGDGDFDGRGGNVRMDGQQQTLSLDGALTAHDDSSTARAASSVPNSGLTPHG